MKFEDAITSIHIELSRAIKLHTKWPIDPIHGAAILAEESGEVVKAALDYSYANGSIDDLQTELIQTAAMAIRNLINLESYKRSAKNART